MSPITHTLCWLAVATLALAVGCGEDKKTPSEPTEVDAGAEDADTSEEVDAEADCTPRPKHLELINAPTTSEKIDKRPELPLLNADGTLPPLP